MLFTTGAIRKAGSVDQGNAATDNLTVERQRGISVRSCGAYTYHNGVTVNIIDTPGHVDFAGEAERSFLAIDYALVLISAEQGIRAHAENIIKALERADMPYLVFINKHTSIFILRKIVLVKKSNYIQSITDFFNNAYFLLFCYIAFVWKIFCIRFFFF